MTSIVSIPVSTSALQPSVGASLRPKMVLYSEYGFPLFVVPYAPREVSHADLIPGYNEHERALGKPMLIRGTGMLRKMSFDLEIVRLHHQESVEDLLTDLRNVMNTAAALYVTYGPQEMGRWRPLGMAIQAMTRNESNEIAAAVVSLEFAEASDPPAFTGPVTGGVTTPETETLITQRPATYTVKAGDTLTSISITFYGNVYYMSAIAKANNIRSDVVLTAGTRLILP